MEIVSLRAAIDARLAKKGSEDFRDATNRMKQGARETDRGVKGVTERLRRLGTTATGLRGVLGSLFAGISTGFAVRDLVSTVARYEQTMRTVRSVTRASVEDFARMTDLTRGLGATTRFSASEAAEGLLFLARAGFDTDKALAALPHTLDLAASGMLGLGEAADLASNIVSQFNLAAAETQRVSDALIVVSNRANTDVRQLGEALKYAGPIAGAFGASVETTAAALGVLGDRGIQASQAGTNLRGVLLALANPTTDAERALAKMGLSLEAVNPAAHDLVDILESLRGAQLDATDAGLIFGRRNAAAALILADSTARIRELEAATKTYAGEAAEQATAQSDTLAGSFKTLRSAVEEAYLATGDKGLTGALRSVVDTVTGAVRILAGMEDEVEGNAAGARALASALKGVGVVIASIGIVKLVGGVVGLARALASATAAATAFAMSPLGLAALAIGAVTAGYFALRRALDDADEGLERHRQRLEEIRQAADDAAAAGNRFIDAMYAGQTSGALGAIRDQIREAQSVLAKLAEDGGGSGRSDSAGTAGARGLTYRYTYANELGTLQAAVREAIASQDPGRIQIAIARLREEEERLVAALEAEREAQTRARRAETLRASLLERIRDAQGEVVAALNASTDAEREAATTRQRLMAEAERVAEALELGEEATRSWLAQVDREITVLEESRQVLAQRTAEEQAAAEAKKAHEEATRRATQAIEAEAAAREAAARGARRTLNEYVADLERQATLLEIVDEGERAVADARLRAAELALAGGEDAASIALYADEVEALVRKIQALEDADQQRRSLGRDLMDDAEEQSALAQRFGDAWGRAFGDFVTGAASAGEAARSLLSSIVQLAAQEFIVNRIAGIAASGLSSLLGGGTTATTSYQSLDQSSILAGFANANGNVFDRGRVTPFGSGGVVAGPTFFPLRGGWGLMGEAGPEAVMPLKRGPDGRLGVEGAGGNVTVHMTVVTPNADSFRKSARQIKSDLRRGMGR